jgi:hypothetical protein
MQRWLLLVAVALLVAGCAAVPQQYAVKEVHICDVAGCNAVNHKYSVGELRAGFLQLLKANEGARVTICDSDPMTRNCESVGICQFVLGGIIPGNGCAEDIVFSEIAAGSQAGQIDLRANMPLTFIWTPLSCATTAATLSVRSADDVSIEFQPRYCNWMVVGNMMATFNFAVESLDLNHGQVGGYWSHAVAGGGNGRGSGYAVLKFPKAMPQGENWLVSQPLHPPPRAQLSREEP